MALQEYRKRRDFRISPEPPGRGEASASQGGGIYVIQKHRASHLHYDFRLESNGTLLSWAVPKGPSLDPTVKRLAMQVDDHPIEYAEFEGVIPPGEYGGGTVMVWDKGAWSPEVPDVSAALEKGDLKFMLSGKKLKGSWVLVRTHGYGHSSKPSWLLIKHRDRFASSTRDIVDEMPRSAISNRLLAEIARAEGGEVATAATGDPPVKKERNHHGAGKQPTRKPPRQRRSSARDSKNLRKRLPK